MKRKIAALMACAAVFASAAVSCGSDEDKGGTSVTLNVNGQSSAAESTAEGEDAESTEAPKDENKDEDKPDESTTEAEEETTEAEEEDSTEETTEEETEDQQNDEPDDDQQQEEPTEAPTEAPAPQPVYSAYNFGFGDLLSGGAISALGSPNYTGTSPACTSSGSDITVYQYNGLEVQSFDNGGYEAICSIVITGSNYSAGGVTIGSSRSDVIAAFGGDGSFYSDGDKELTFSYSGDSVSYIEFYYPA